MRIRRPGQPGCTAYCFGAAVHLDPETHKAVPVYLDIAGPATSVEVAWARLVQGKELTIVPDNAPAIYLQPPIFPGKV